MGTQLKYSRDKLSTTLKPLFQVLVRIPVHIDRWITDQMFLRSLNNPAVGRPSAIGQAVALYARFWRVIRSMWNEAYTEYALHVYKRENPAHYEAGGRGYLDLVDLSEQKCRDLFSKLESRLQLFVDTYPVIVSYKDGESFLDAGCGKGQNLKYIASRYPRSQYIGFDIDARCLQIARMGVAGSVTRVVSRGSMLDEAFLKSFADKSIDHVVVCHVLSTLLEPTIHQTKLSHQRIIDEFIRIARKTVLIIDQMSLGGAFRVEIEQLTRALVREDVTSYFNRHRSIGEACLLSHENSYAVLFKTTAA